MQFSFVPMTEEYADEMIHCWRYPGEYAIYDYAEAREFILDQSIWGRGLFAVLDETSSLVGEVTLEFYDDDDIFIDYAQVESEMWTDSGRQAFLSLGFGLKPELTGRGLGQEFVTACVDFGISHFNYRGQYVLLGVAEFNQRAIKVYERVGFQTFKDQEVELAGQTVRVLRMRKLLSQMG